MEAGAVNFLVEKLNNEISLIRGLEEDVEKLKETLGTVQGFLEDAQSKIIDVPLKRWLQSLEDIAFDADNVLDEFDYNRLSKEIAKTEKKKELCSFTLPWRSWLSSLILNLTTCAPCFNFCTPHRGMALAIKKINEDFESAKRTASELIGLNSRLAVAGPARSDGTDETDSFAFDPIFVGRDDDVSRIVEMLLNACPTDEHVFSIFPIQGMGGLGKTTLARKVFNHEKIRTHFGKHIWVHVSTNFGPNVVLKKILTALTSEHVEVENREAILKKLKDALETKTYLLVLDDVWNQDPHKWGGFINSLSGISSTNGNVIVVTTRNREVASVVEKPPLSIYELKGIPTDSCWSIIKEKSIGARNIPSEEFETIGRQIAERCGGLPLAANVVGGVLRGKSKDVWVSIQRDWLSDGEGDVISKILKLSYDNLSSPSLKKCFAYCSIFPKGDWIERGELIELWMAEGFLGTGDMETEGDKFVNLLLQSSLLQAEREVFSNVENCSMHDLVHDVASLALGSSKDRYMRWECNGGESSRLPEEQAKCLRTLFYRGKISDITFSKFRSLHSLTLEDNAASELPDTIRELIHLRFLNISETGIKSLPDSIGELYHLQTLRAEDAEQLPSTLKDLINLRHLHVRDYFDELELPPELGRLTSLRTLPRFEVQDKEGHRIEELGSLNNIKGRLKIHGLENVHSEEETKKANLFQKKNIVQLELWWTSRGGGTNHENVLEGLQPHEKLKKLAIWRFGGAKFPSWTLNMAVRVDARWIGFDDLKRISLQQCSKCEELPMLGHLPRLKSLCLVDLGNVRSIGSSFYNIGNCSSNNGVCTAFRALESLTLGDMPNLTEWVEVELPTAVQVEVFPCLKELEIRRCPQLISVPHQFPCREELWIDGCPNIKSIPYFCSSQGLTSLHSLRIQNCERLMNLSLEMVKSCAASLETLEIVNVPRLIHILGESGKFCKLRVLKMGPCASDSWDCASFNKIVDGILHSSRDTLSFVTLRGMEDWDSLPDSLQHLTALQDLTLDNFGIEELHEWLGNLTSLRRLTLSDCIKLRHLPSVEAMPCLTKLMDLNILNCPILKQRYIQQQTDGDIDSEWPKISHIPNVYIDKDRFRYGKKVFDGMLRTSRYARSEVTLSGGVMDSLPDWLRRRRTTLLRLNLENFGMEELPQWLGNLRLASLTLCNGNKLRRLPSVEVMRRLTELSFLYIHNCPLLELRCIQQTGDDDDFKWPEISHIPDVYVNGDWFRYGRKVI